MVTIFLNRIRRGVIILYFKKFFIAAAVFLMIYNHAYAQGDSYAINLKQGFNFVSFTVKPDVSPGSLKVRNPAVLEIYSYSAGSGSFLSAGEGTLAALNIGRGYIIKSNADVAMTFSGGASTQIGDIVMRSGFNLAGFSKIPEIISFSNLMQKYPGLRGVYKWSPASGSFIQVIKNDDNTVALLDGIDPQFVAGQAYFIRVSSDCSLNYDADNISFKFPVISSVGIPALASGETFSKTVLKPGSGLSTVIGDFSENEYILAAPYNRSPVNNSYQMSIYANNQAPSADLAAALKAPVGENITVEFAGQMRRDISMRSLEGRNAISKLDEVYYPAAKSPAERPSKMPAVGDSMTFYSLNSLRWPPSESDWTRVTAKLRAIGSRCYIYEDESVPYPYMALSASDISRFAASFDDEIYPKDTAAFGSEPTPGVDNDARVYILFTKNVNYQTAAGYFDSTNQLKQSYLDASSSYNINSNGEKYYSNEKEMFYMAAPKQSSQGQNYQVNTLGVLAHEFQHMINWNQHNSLNPNALEESWLNEGLSQVAQDICGYGYQYGTLAFIMDPFLRSPESYSLTKFQFGLGYYGYSYLFTRYLIDRGAVPQNLVKTSNIGKNNAETEIKRAGLASSFDDFFEDFIAALYLSNTGITGDARYNFKSVNIRAAQNDPAATKLSGPAATRDLGVPVSFESSSPHEYGFHLIKCSPASGSSPTSQNFSMTDNTSGNIGVIILRIKK